MGSSFKLKIIELKKSGFTHSEISEKLGCSKSTISFHCSKEGLSINTSKVNDVKAKEMQEFYNSCKSSIKTAKEFNLSKSTVLKYIKTDKSVLSTEQKRKNNVKRVSDRRKELKNKSIEYMGSMCSKCGYDKAKSALEFHHKDPTKKDFSISMRGYTMSWEKVKKELDKCIMVCANCHREIHEKINNKSLDN